MMTRADDRVDSRVGGIPFSVRGLNMPLMIAFVSLVGGLFWFMVVENRAQHDALIAAVEDQTMVLLAPEDKQAVLYQFYKSKFEKRNRVVLP